jgi:hydroxymethylbilane synthase
LVLIKTTGDAITDRALHEAGGKGLFTKEIEQALLAGEVDLAVHSYKDVPVTMPLVDQAKLVIAAVPKREDPRDVLVSPGALQFAQLAQNARMGTGSLRRQCQLRAIRPDLRIELIRGNIDTRLRKVRGGEYDAILLAFAGLRRSALFDGSDMRPVELEEMLPAAGQGALALQCRRDDRATRQLLAGLHDTDDAACVDLEREVVRSLGGDCHSPIAALATVEGSELRLRTAVGARGGELPVVRAEARGPRENPAPVLDEVMRSLRDQGAEGLLRGGA